MAGANDWRDATGVADMREGAPPRGIASAAWHSLAWLVVGNAIGVMLAVMLLLPKLNLALGDWTYGRWMPVHMNLQLYGWISLPLVAFLFHAYGVDRGAAAKWCRPMLWVWSTALMVGSLTWLAGHSSGKLFLDWTGYSRVLFPLALAALWLVLAMSLASDWYRPVQRQSLVRFGKVIGLTLLLLVPVLLYVAASPNLYPPINPDSGGPTGASQLESTLIVIAILLLLPFGISTRKNAEQRSRAITAAWIIFAAECVLCLGLGRADVSHHRPVQYISLGSLLVWLPLTPVYYNAFVWHQNTKRWRRAFQWWWAALVLTGWTLFLPGVLDRFKFTDGLVAHSLLAMAGFSSSLLTFVMVQLLGDGGWIFNGRASFYAWQGAVLAYVALFLTVGWIEGGDPSFTIVPGMLRNSFYTARVLIGVVMLIASVEWLVYASQLLRSMNVQGETV